MLVHIARRVGYWCSLFALGPLFALGAGFAVFTWRASAVFAMSDQDRITSGTDDLDPIFDGLGATGSRGVRGRSIAADEQKTQV